MTRNHANVTLVGMGKSPADVVITSSLSAGQAVAAAVRADRAVFKNCRFLGYQDTLFANYGRQYYVHSYIESAADFIFGNTAAVFDHTEIHAVGPGHMTTQSRISPDQPTGYVIVTAKSPAAFRPARRATPSASAGPGGRFRA